VFEIRQKPVDVPEVFLEQPELYETPCLYSLCRAWEKGRYSPVLKHDEPEVPKVKTRRSDKKGSAISAEDQADFITREIHKLPAPDPVSSDDDDPSLVLPFKPAEPVDLSDSKSVLKSYLPHWTRIKREWIQRARRKETPYRRSLEVIDAIFNLGQQQQLY